MSTASSAAQAVSCNSDLSCNNAHMWSYAVHTDREGATDVLVVHTQKALSMW